MQNRRAPLNKRSGITTLLVLLIGLVLPANTAKSAIQMLGNAQVGGGMQVTDPLRFTATETGNVIYLVLKDAVSGTPNDPLQQVGVFGFTERALLLTNLDTGQDMAFTQFADGTTLESFNDLTPRDPFFAGESLSITAGDTIELAATDVISFGINPSFDPELANRTFADNLVLSDNSFNTIATLVPEPTSALFLASGAALLVRRRQRRSA